MAAGDIKWFAQALRDIGMKIHNLETDTFYLGLVSASPAPTVGTAAPHWGGTGTTNFFTTQATPLGTSYAGPKLLEIGAGGAGSQTWALVGTVPTLRADPIVMTVDGTSFTDARYGIIYNDSDANKRCLAFLDLGATLSLVTGGVTIDWSGVGNDILTLTQS